MIELKQYDEVELFDGRKAIVVIQVENKIEVLFDLDDAVCETILVDDVKKVNYYEPMVFDDRMIDYCLKFASLSNMAKKKYGIFKWDSNDIPKFLKEKFIIRQLNKKDVDRVLDIWYNSSVDTYTFISKDHWDLIKDKVRSKFLESKIYVYEEDSIIKGFILIEDGYIDELYVDKKYRSNGIGKQLLNYVKSDYEELTLNIFQKNVDGIRFYQNNGFIVVEENTEDSTNEKGYFMKWHK